MRSRDRFLIVPSLTLCCALPLMAGGSLDAFASADAAAMGGAGGALRGRVSNAVANPAALAGTTNRILSVGASAHWVNGRYADPDPTCSGKLEEQILPLPHAFAALPLNDRWMVGLAISAPEAHSVTWHWNRNIPGRTRLDETTLAVAEFTPSLAWKANDTWSMAIAPQFYYCVTHELDFLTQDARGRRTWHNIDADGRGLGALLSVNAVLPRGCTLSSRLSTGAKLDMDYSSRYAVGPETGTVLGDLRMPLEAGVGLSKALGSDTLVAMDATWTQWDPYDGDAGSEYEDGTLSLGLGVEHRWDARWTLRAGYRFDEGCSYDAALFPTWPVGDKHTLSAGAGYTPDGRRGVDVALANTQGEELTSRIAGMSGELQDFRAWTAVVSGWWNF